AVAGEKFKARTVTYIVKIQAIDIPDEKGHVLYVFENKGIVTVFQGLQAKKYMDGIVNTSWGVADSNPKTEQWSGRGYAERIDRDGDKIYMTWEGQSGKEGVQGTLIFVKGTGKFEGIKGKATWLGVSVAPNQGYNDFEGEVDWPR
ncbi:MAG: hypothetical protein ABSB32_22265, partial [Thermodesulfobacteriota bacterium]